jgi:hypothetical protein
MKDVSSFPGFEKCVEMIRSRNALLFEEAFGWLVGWSDTKPRVIAYGTELVELMQAETDPRTRAIFIELLGFTESKSVLPILQAELLSPFPEVREWATLSLNQLGFHG